MADDKANNILGIAAILAIAFLLWWLTSRKRKVIISDEPEPDTTPSEVEDEFKSKGLFCDKIIYRPLSPYGPFASNLMGAGWCYRGDGSFFDGKVDMSYGDKYSEEQAQAYSDLKQEEGIRNINRQSIYFRLINSTAAKITTDVLAATKDVIPFIPIPDAPVAYVATGIGYSQFTANWRLSAGATGYYLDVATDIGFTNCVLGYQNLDIGNVLTRLVVGLIFNTNYFYRVRAYNANGTSSNSNTISIATLAPVEVIIGAQIWLEKNVDVNIIGSKVYDNDESSRVIYGGLYNWSMLATIDALYPGYHVPSKVEWETLIAFLGGIAIAGGTLKEVGTVHWVAPNTAADNTSGFTGLPGCSSDSMGGGISAPHKYGHFWSSTEFLVNFAYEYILGYDTAAINVATPSKPYYFSVRLIKD